MNNVCLPKAGKCNGHATVFKFTKNSFHVHAFSMYFFAIVSFFYSRLSNFICFYADLGKNKMEVM